MKNVLKNWAFAFVGFVLVILDQGFEVLNPFLIELGTPEKWIGFIKLAFGLFAIYKLKISLPTQNEEKLKDLVNKNIGGGGIQNPK